MSRPPVVLNYHGLGNLKSEHDPVRLFLTEDRFRRQISTLLRRDYRFVKMRDFARSLHEGESLEGTCAITFDDGSEDGYSLLPPLLEELGVPATIYICPGILGEPYPWLSPEASVRFMTKEELLVVAARPDIEIGAHTVAHTRLGSASFEMAYDEMVRCKADLEDMLGFAVPSFCYPGCIYSPPCPEAAEKAGYTSAVTCGPRGSWNPFELRRESLHRTDGRLTFEFKVRGHYYKQRDNPVIRSVRWATRPIRHLR